MMLPLLQSLRYRQDLHGITHEAFYRYLGISRQGFFQALNRKTVEEAMLARIFKLVTDYRSKIDRRAGSRSLYKNLDIKAKFNIGINKFEQLMSAHGKSLAPLRIKVVTTQSSYQSWNYRNLISGLTICDINKVVVGDLCYVSIERYRYFLFCITDVYSARIVGYYLGERMRAEEGKNALDRWVNLRGAENLACCIHHTDGGSQYFSTLYLTAMKVLSLQISVAGNCLENGFAEQRNGLLKHHLLPTVKYPKGPGLAKEMERIMYVYNYERKQEALGWLTPVEYEQKWSGTGRSGITLYDLQKGKPSVRF